MTINYARLLNSIADALHVIALEQYPKPNIIKSISNEDIFNFFLNIDPSINITLLDRIYTVLTEDSIVEFLEIDKISDNKYIAESYDCDNFAFDLVSATKEWCNQCAMGIVLGYNADGDYHAWNFVLIANDNGMLDMLFIEPQTDDIFEMTTEQIAKVII